MAFLVYLIARALGRMLPWDRSDRVKDLEILVLRHQLKVLRRKSPRPHLRNIDSALLAGLARMLRREHFAVHRYAAPDRCT